jgi:hypothetical protein
MNKRTRKYDAAKWAAVLALTLIAATGCSNELVPNSKSYVQPSHDQSSTYLSGDTPQKTYLQGQEEGQTGSEPMSLDEGGDTSAASTGGSSTKQASAWNASHPIMLGLSIGDSNKLVAERFGKANDIYSLEDKSESIEVHEYKGFAVGINDKHTIQYIEVYDKSIVTGLSGVHVEDRSDAVLKALGKPSSQNSFIITYEGKDSLLKIDLDPDHDKIVSIKLLAVT